MQTLDGKKVSSEILNDLKEEVQKQSKAPGLGVILVGQDEASRIYVSLKRKAAERIGIRFQLRSLPEDSREGAIISEVEKLNADDSLDGIIVQLPLPEGIDRNKVIETIDPQKDVDGFHPENIRRFFENDSVFLPVFPESIWEIIKSSGETLEGKKALIVCNSDEFGKMMQKTLANNSIGSEYFFNGEVAGNLEKLKQADIVISACGIADLISGKMLKSGAIIIDGGIVKEGNRVVGDVDLESLQDLPGFVSPVPGGVGPVTIACLLKNVVLAHKKSR